MIITARVIRAADLANLMAAFRYRFMSTHLG